MRCVCFDDDKTSDMQAIKPAEGDKSVIGVGFSDAPVHRGKQLTQAFQFSTAHGRYNHEG